jgi:hypothetical protein
MKVLLPLLLSFTLYTDLTAQNWNWTKVVGQGVCHNMTGVADSKGFVYTAIHCGNSYTTTTSFCSYNPIFAKHDSLGNVLWVQSCTQGAATILDMDIDGSDNLYVTGVIGGNCTLCGGNLPDTTVNGPSFIAKYNENGDLLWVNSWSYPNIPTSAYEIETDPAGNSVVSGYGYSQYYGEVTYLKKFRSTGILIWDQSYIQQNPFQVTDLDVDATGNCYIAGYFHDSLEINQHKLYGNTPICNICFTSFIAKLDWFGNVVWLKKLGGNDTYCQSINLDWQGHFFVSGYCLKPCSAGNTTLNPVGFVAKFDTSGNNLWALNQQPRASYAITDRSGNFYTSGLFMSGSASFGTNSNSLTLTSIRSHELFLAKYDALGNPVWAMSPTSISAYGFNDPQQLICDYTNRLYLVGGFSGVSAYGNTTLTNTTIISSLNAFITRVGVHNSSVTGIDKIQSGDCKIFPNPANESITISLNEKTSEILQVVITDITNKLVFRGVINESRDSEIDVRHLSPGIYMLHIEGKNINTRKKLSKI